MALKGLVSATGMEAPDLTPILEVLGTIGLIMIVLEASLDLELEREKRKVISRAFFTSLVTLILSATAHWRGHDGLPEGGSDHRLLLCRTPFHHEFCHYYPQCFRFQQDKREFMVYESTFSDILGIMLFYFLISSMKAESVGEMGLDVLLNLSLTVLVSVSASYLLIFLFQKIRTELKLFLLIAVLILLYGISKMFHLSSLLIILVFGLMLSNRNIFFPGKAERIPG